MADVRDRDKKKSESGESIAKDYVARLSEEHKMLLILKSQLYEGSWDQMLEDLNNRLQGKPYIFKLAGRIQDDVKRIEELRSFEKEHEVDLSDYVSLD